MAEATEKYAYKTCIQGGQQSKALLLLFFLNVGKLHELFLNPVFVVIQKVDFLLTPL